MISALGGKTIRTTNLSNSINLANCVVYYDWRYLSSYSGSGTTVNDLSQKGNTGTITVVGAGTYDFATEQQRRLRLTTPFSLASDNVSIVSGSTISDFGVGTGDFALETWVRFNTLTADSAAAMIFSFNPAGGTNRVALYLRVTSPVERIQGYINGASIAVSSANSITTGIWYHLVFTRIGTSCRLYINGANDGTGTSSASGQTTGRATVAINTSNATRRVVGGFGLVRGYNGRGLTAEEVLKNYNLEKGYFYN